MSAGLQYKHSLRDLPLADPSTVPEGWSAADEARYLADGIELDADDYAEYLRDGGTREFKDWLLNPCLTCSGRHETSAAELAHRPTFTYDRAEVLP